MIIFSCDVQALFSVLINNYIYREQKILVWPESKVKIKIYSTIQTVKRFNIHNKKYNSLLWFQKQWIKHTIVFVFIVARFSTTTAHNHHRINASPLFHFCTDLMDPPMAWQILVRQTWRSLYCAASCNVLVMMCT
jgi:hypothetical protein